MAGWLPIKSHPSDRTHARNGRTKLKHGMALNTETEKRDRTRATDAGARRGRAAGRAPARRNERRPRPATTAQAQGARMGGWDIRVESVSVGLAWSCASVCLRVCIRVCCVLSWVDFVEFIIIPINLLQFIGKFPASALSDGAQGHHRGTCVESEAGVPSPRAGQRHKQHVEKSAPAAPLASLPPRSR